VIDGGHDEAKIAELPTWRDSEVFSEQERVAIEYGERMTITGQTVDDAFFDRLRQHFTEPQIVELTAGIAMENFRSKFNAPFLVEAQGFCPLPKR
jgi:alkylhydroperoxidase family enzyme